MTELGDITVLLREADAGRAGALDELMRLVYADLERVASAQLHRRFGAGAGAITLEPAALVNESFLKLIRGRMQYDDRGHFFATATKAMLQVLIDYGRRRRAAKRGGADPHITLVLDERQVANDGDAAANAVEVEALAAAIERLEGVDPRQADVVKLRVVWGLDPGEIADAIGTSRSTVDREWRFAKAWLAEELDATSGAPG